MNINQKFVRHKPARIKPNILLLLSPLSAIFGTTISKLPPLLLKLLLAPKISLPLPPKRRRENKEHIINLFKYGYFQLIYLKHSID